MTAWSSIRLRLWLPTLVVAGFATLLTVSAFWRYQRETTAMDARVRQLVSTRLYDAEPRVEQLLAERAIGLVSQEVAQLGAAPSVEDVALVSDQGRVIAATQARAVGLLLTAALPEFNVARAEEVQRIRTPVIDRDARNEHLLAYHPVMLGGVPGALRAQAVGTLVLRYDLQSAKRHVRNDVLRGTSIEASFALLMIAILFVMVRRWLTEPLAHLQQAVRRISRGDLQTEIALRGSGELAALAGDIDRMTAALRSAAAERDRSERALLESAQDLAITLHSIGDGVIATDAAGRITRMNPVAERLTGCSLRDAVERPLTEVFRIVNAQTRQAVDDPVRLVLAHNRVVELANHTTLIARDGREYQIAESAAPIRDEAGDILGIVLVFSDVTEQYGVREELARTTEMLEHTGALAKVGGWELDVRAKKLTWSRETFRFHEIDATEMPPLETAFNFYAPEARAEITRLVDAAITRGEPYDVELPLITAKQRRIWVRAQCSPVVVDGVVVRLRGAFHDISDRRRAEEERERSRDLLVKLASLVPSALYQYRLNPDGSSAFPYASPGINTIYEVTPEEVREDATPVFGRLHPEDAARVGELSFESARTLNTFFCEFRVILPRQGLRWRWLQAQPERTEDGGTLWHGIISDITERKEAEAAKQALEAQLTQAQKMESVGLLAGGIAHDFNNMLGVILGNIELVLANLDPASSSYVDLMDIRKAAMRSADLTRQLLAFARKQDVSARAIDVNATIAEEVTILQRLIGEHIALAWRPGASLWPVWMDPTQLDQILTNLCINAQAAIDGVGTVTIETSNREVDAAAAAEVADALPGAYVCLTVSDTGRGMDAATMARIFEPFFTTKKTGAGTGLGLATVYGAVRQNRGFIRVASVPGQGSTFEIHFPRHNPSTDCDERSRTDAGDAAARRGRETILLVEDEPAILRLAQRILAGHGYEVHAAGSPGEALRLAELHRDAIDLLLTDVIMPGMNGRDLAEAVRALVPSVRHLFMSGHTADIITHQGRLEPGIRLIEKPFTKATLTRVVRDVLDEVPA
ncbi:MAG: PAS domain S-box protein [Gemmatimonadetes bacterium]|nr:PAS domain S-box protein [Gemmatimonadota bacterium]